LCHFKKNFYGAIENLPSSISIPETLINGVGGFKIVEFLRVRMNIINVVLSHNICIVLRVASEDYFVNLLL
jgi:hypothetical protein